MNECAGCGKEVAEEFCAVPRLPCPFCGATGRRYFRGAHESLTVNNSVSWLQTRPTENGSASLNSSGRIELILTGRPPRNEEGSLAASIRLVRRLNADGADWGEPISGIGDVDAVSTAGSDPNKKLSIQVVRAATDESLWQALARQGSAEKPHDTAAAAQELLNAVRKKAAKYPEAQRGVLTLVLDAGRTPNFTFKNVHDLFAKAHKNHCRSFGFLSVWVVGAVDALVTRLDT